MTKEDAQMIFQELATSVALMGSGMGIARSSTIAFGKMIANPAYKNFIASSYILQKCPLLLAKAAEIGMDATLCLIATYAITGQIDLTAEGRSQLIPIITGLIKAKGRPGAYLNDYARYATTMVNKNKKNEVDVVPKKSQTKDLDPTESIKRSDKNKSFFESKSAEDILEYAKQNETDIITSYKLKYKNVIDLDNFRDFL